MSSPDKSMAPLQKWSGPILLAHSPQKQSSQLQGLGVRPNTVRTRYTLIHKVEEEVDGISFLSKAMT